MQRYRLILKKTSKAPSDTAFLSIIKEEVSRNSIYAKETHLRTLEIMFNGHCSIISLSYLLSSPAPRWREFAIPNSLPRKTSTNGEREGDFLTRKMRNLKISLLKSWFSQKWRRFLNLLIISWVIFIQCSMFHVQWSMTLSFAANEHVVCHKSPRQ